MHSYHSIIIEIKEWLIATSCDVSVLNKELFAFKYVAEQSFDLNFSSKVWIKTRISSTMQTGFSE
jgi:hypothetical protein